MSLRTVLAGRVAIENPYTTANVFQQGAESVAVDYQAPGSMTVKVLYPAQVINNNSRNVLNCSVYEYGTSTTIDHLLSEDDAGFYLTFVVVPGESYLVFFSVDQIPALINAEQIPVTQI